MTAINHSMPVSKINVDKHNSTMHNNEMDTRRRFSCVHFLIFTIAWVLLTQKDFRLDKAETWVDYMQFCQLPRI